MRLGRITTKQWGEDLVKVVGLGDFNFATSNEASEKSFPIDINEFIVPCGYGEVPYIILLDEWDMGASSISPNIQFVEESTTFQQVKEMANYQITEVDMEKDFIIKMEPLERKRIKVKIKKIREADLLLVEDDFK